MADGNDAFDLRLRLARLRAGTSLVAEALWPPLLALLGLAVLLPILAWFGLFAALPDFARIALLLLLLLGALAVLWRARRIRLPGRAAIDSRIEAESRLVHQPLAVQGEDALGEDAFSQALFRAHRERMAARLSDLRGGSPRTATERLDPYGLRALAALLLVTAFAFSHGPGGGRLADAFAPLETTVLAAPRVDAWVTPPAYTGRAPLFLTQESAGTLAVPENSVFSVRISDAAGATLSYAVSGGETLTVEAAGGEAAASAGVFDLPLTASGAASLETRLRTLGTWSFDIVPDLAPTIELAGPPEVARNGALDLAYAVTDDYGAIGGAATIAVEDLAPDARPLVEAPEIRLSMPRRGRGERAGRTSVDLVESPYAGAAVTLTLTATDDAGQIGRSEPLALMLPERRFADPLARAVVEQRRILALDAGAAPRVVEMLDAVTLRGDGFIERAGDYMALRAARTRIATARGDEDLLSAVDLLWEIALGIEDGELSFAERRLRDAQEALAEALEDGASDEEIASLMEELREAMDEFMAAMAEQMRDQPPGQMQAGEMQEIRPQDLQRMLDRIEDLARAGSPEAARELLAELQSMLDNLQQMQAGSQPQGEPSAAEQQMNQLGEMLQRQQELMDRTFDLGRQSARRQMGESGMPGEAGSSPPMSEEELAEAMRDLEAEQGALEEALRALQEEIEAAGQEPGEGLGEAEAAMGEAEGALGEGDDGRALGRQGEAMEAMRRGAAEMMSRMQAEGQGNQPNGQQGQGYGPGRQSSGRDPLGRERPSRGTDYGQDVEVPDEIDVQRARRILDEIRNRLGDRLSPQLEREYLERLLQTP